MGVCDTPIAEAFLINRYLRIADGPDEVHMAQLGRIANYRRLKKLLRGWENETERLIDAARPPTP
jgi:hypothetical protein